MAGELFTKDFEYYQSANADADRIRENFLVRLHEYDIIINDLRSNPMEGSVQHFLLIGRRGSGKSTLLKRLEIEISGTELSKTYIAVNLAEEQANIYKLYDLLEEVIVELSRNGIDIEESKWNEDITSYSRALFVAIHKALEKSGKKLVLLLDNIDRIFENIHDEASLLREYLLNFDDIKIIGGSTRMTEHFWKYNKPFYEFFRVLELKPLSGDEIRRLLLNWSEKMDLPELKAFIDNKPGQLEMVRILTDGLPRTLLFFVNILITRAQETGYEYLRLIMDSVTPLYQERLNSLPPSQRKIILQLAFLWESAGAKELAESTRMENKLISAQLKQLIDKGIVEKVETPTKNNLYRLGERFFNLWLIFTQGSPAEKRRARCLTIFLENFYDSEELLQLANRHLKELEDGKLLPNKAAIITKALAQSRFIDTNLRDSLIDKTLEIKNIAYDLKLQLPPTSAKIREEVEELLKKQDYKKAIRLAENIEQEDGFRDFLLGIVYFFYDDYKNSEKHLLASSEKGKDVDVLLGTLYLSQWKLDLALPYLKDPKKSYTSSSYYRIGRLLLENNSSLAEQYFDLAVNQEPQLSYPVAILFMNKFLPNPTEKYLKIAIDKRIPNSASAFATLIYLIKGDRHLAFDYLKLEREFKDSDKSLLLGAEIMLDLWSGQLDRIHLKVTELLETENLKIIEGVVISMLVHSQINMAFQLFTNSQFANILQQNFKPLHYAISILAQKEELVGLKVPPEIRETVDKILADAESLKKYYQSSDDN